MKNKPNRYTEGMGVWCRHRTSKKGDWTLIDDPHWTEGFLYVLDGKWAKLEMAQIDGKELQLWARAPVRWHDAKLDSESMDWTDPELWRIKRYFETDEWGHHEDSKGDEFEENM